MQTGFDLNSCKLAVVTGGASGIGRAMAIRLAKSGADIAICDIHGSRLIETEVHLRRLGARVLACDTDVGDRDAMFRFADRVHEQFGPASFLFNNAGVGGEWGGLATSSQKDWSWCMRINVSGVVHGLEAFAGTMLRAGGAGAIVNTSSIAGLLPGAGMGSYSPSKYAVVSISEALAMELKDTRLTVSVLCPGFVATDFLDSGRNLQSAPRMDADNQDLAQRRIRVRRQMEESMRAETVVGHTISAVARGDLFITPHAEFRDAVEARSRRILGAFDVAREFHGEVL